MKNKIRVHDGILGAVILLSVILAYTVNMQWLFLAGVVAILMISSAFSGFCLVYFILHKVMPAADADRK